MSCHIDELRPSGKNAITLEVAQGVTVRQLFYGGLEYTGLESQTSEVSSSMAFERLTSVEEEAMEEGGEGEGISVVKSIQEDGEKMEVEDVENEVGDEPMESSENDDVHQKDSVQVPSISHEVQPASSALLGTKKFSDVYTQCVRLNSCIQAAASRLQDSTLNKQRATARVRKLIQVIPQKPTFPLGIGHCLCGKPW